MNLAELHFGYDKRTFSRALLSKIPVFASVFEASPGRDVFFVDRNAEKFDQVVSYAIQLQSPTSTAAISKLSKSVLYEAEHYGFSQSDNESDAVEAKAGTVAESILKNSLFLFDLLGHSVALSKLPIYETSLPIDDTSEGEEKESDFFFVSACGVQFWTTKTTLRKLPFFSGVVNGSFVTNFTGQKDDPYHLDIPSNIFSRILERTRDERCDLEEGDWVFYGSLGGTCPLGDETRLPDMHDLQRRFTSASINSGAALMDLVSVGKSDSIICAAGDNASPSPWKVAIQKIRKSSAQRGVLQLQGAPTLSAQTHKEPWKISFSRRGDLVHTIFLEFLFPNVTSEYQNADLVKLIDQVEVSLTFNTIDVIHGYQLQQIASLNPNAPNLEGTNFVHLPFWFSEHRGCALNTAGLNASEVELVVYLKSRGVFAHQAIQVRAHIQYVFVDSDALGTYRDKMTQNLCMLHRSIHTNAGGNFAEEDVRTFVIRCDQWKHLCPFIVFSLHRDDSHDESFNPLPDLVNFQFSLNQVVIDAGSNDIAARVNKWNSKMVYDENLHTYTISPSLDAFGYQPTGWWGFERIDNIELRLVTSKRVGCVRVWSRSYHVFYTQGNGFGGVHNITVPRDGDEIFLV